MHMGAANGCELPLHRVVVVGLRGVRSGECVAGGGGE